MLLVRARAEFLCGAPIADVTGEAVDSADGWNMEHGPGIPAAATLLIVIRNDSKK